MAYDYEKMTDEELTALANALLNGDEEMEPDPEEAVRVLKTAADRGNADALCDYGTCLMNGIGTEKDDASAVRCWQTAAEKGCVPAMFKLAVCLLKGLGGLPKDESKAAEYFTRAAQGGDPNSLFNLAILYENGVGVEKDPHKSRMYLEEAAGKKYPLACLFLGMKRMSEAGEDAEKQAAAAALVATAAEAGEPQAQFFYGSFFENGTGVEKDLAEASGWYRRSAKAGFVPANRALQNLGFPGVI